MDTKLTRRQFLKGATIAGVGMALPLKFGTGRAYAFYTAGPALTMFAQPLRGVGPGGIPVAGPDAAPAEVTGAKHYTINTGQFTDTLHPSLGPTNLWGYHPNSPLGGPQAQAHLGGIIVATRGQAVQITFRNNFPAKHIIPVDTTIPGANQAQNRTAVHIHGGLVPGSATAGRSTGGRQMARMA